jgi:hypothetical protein
MLISKLYVPVSRETIIAIKSDLFQSFAQIKSSLLSEAIARGLGYNTHASLLSETNSGAVREQAVSGLAFANFLHERGYSVDSKSIDHAAARVAIRKVMDREPRLTYWGIGIGRYRRGCDGTEETTIEHRARFLYERERLLADTSIAEFLQSLVLVQQIKPIKSINSRSGSYGLKHRAEKLSSAYPDGTGLCRGYVANGSLIAAAIYAGFIYKTYVDALGFVDVNVAFNMSQKSLDDVLFDHLASRGLTVDSAQRAARRKKLG